MKKMLNIVLLFLMVTTLSIADNVDPKITVSGIGKIEVEPNIATINMSVETSNIDLSIAKDENDSRIESVVEALLEAEVSEEDFYTSNFNIYDSYVEPYVEGKERTKKYIVRNDIKITVRNIEKVGEIISVLEENGANNIQGISYATTKVDEVQLDALELAYLDAKMKAKRIANIEGYDLEPFDIKTVGNMARPQYSLAYESVRSTKSSTPIYSPNDLEVSANITVTFKMIK